MIQLDSGRFDDLEIVFVQEYFDGCREDAMEGTKEHPCFASGQVKESLPDNRYTLAWKTWVSKTRPGIITPSFIKGKKNIYIAGKYFRNVDVLEGEARIDGDAITQEISIL